ncbi:MAG: hypothetical protein ABJA10_03480 [Aestuariivirga sp.]
MANYNPPEQPRLLQLFDIICLVGAIFLALWFPLYMGWAGISKTLDKIDNPTWETLKQTPAMSAQWEKLGMTPETAHDIIQNKWVYTVDWIQLAIMTIVLVGYFVFLFRASNSEYRDVIDEKFNSK